MTMSAPSASGQVSTGVAIVESTPRVAPASWAIAAIAEMSLTAHGRISRCFQPDHACPPRLDCRLDSFRTGRIDEGCVDTECAGIVGEPFLECPVHDVGRDDVRGTLEGQEGRGRGRHAGTEHEAGGGAF
jgi:hypothetical protein